MRKLSLLGLFTLLALIIAISSGCASSEKTLATLNTGNTLATLKEAKTNSIVPLKTEYSPEVGYVGSGVCGDCHGGEYANWSESLHGKMLQDPKKDPSIVIGDFTKVNNPLDVPAVKEKYTKDDFVLTIGSKNKQRYVVQDGEALRILPYEWIVGSQSWQAYHPDDWNKIDYKDACISCHSTGYDSKTRQYKELGVSCEACHGPGEKHAKSEKVEDIVNPAKLPIARQTEVCAQCHNRGENAKIKTREDAYGFLPGNTLNDFFKPIAPKFVAGEKNFYEDGDSKAHHQQYNDYVQSEHYKSGLLSCQTCHDSHSKESPNLRVTKTNAEIRNLCASCHYEDFKDIPPADKFEIEKYMPKRAKSGVPNDITTHTFRIPLKAGE